MRVNATVQRTDEMIFRSVSRRVGGEESISKKRGRRGEEGGKNRKQGTKNHLVIYCLFSSVTTDNSSSSGYPLIIAHNW